MARWTMQRSEVPRIPLKPTERCVSASSVIGWPPSQPMKSGCLMPNLAASIWPVKTSFSYSYVLIPVSQTWLALVHATR